MAREKGISASTARSISDAPMLRQGFWRLLVVVIFTGRMATVVALT